MFLSKDSPSQVGLICQDHLQAKTASCLLHSNGTGIQFGERSSPPLE